MNIRGIVLEAFNQPWLIHQNSLPGVVALLNQVPSAIKQGDVNAEVHKDYYPRVMAARSAKANAANSGKDVVVLSINGVVGKNDYCGTPGTATLANWIAEFDTNPNVAGVVLKIDSGGGAVHGTHTLVKAIENAKKPLVAFIDDMAASAAYWPAAACQHIMLKDEMSMVGSVGAMWNMSRLVGESQKVMGLKMEVKTVYSRLSPEKNKEQRQFQEEGKTDLAEDFVTDLDEVFTASVQKNRPNASKDAIQGDMYRGQKALDMGLADGYGSMQDAVNKVFALAEEIKMQSNTPDDMSGKTEIMVPADQWGAINAKATAFEALAGAMNLSETTPEAELVTAGEAAVANSNVVGAVTALFGEDAKAEGFNLEASVKALQETVAKQESEIAEMKGNAEEPPKPPLSGKQDNVDTNLEAENHISDVTREMQAYWQETHQK